MSFTKTIAQELSMESIIERAPARINIDIIATPTGPIELIMLTIAYALSPVLNSGKVEAPIATQMMVSVKIGATKGVMRSDSLSSLVEAAAKILEKSDGHI